MPSPKVLVVVFDGLRLVSLAQAACESRGCSAKDHMAIVQQDRVATFLLKKSAFTPASPRADRTLVGARTERGGPAFTASARLGGST